MAIIAEALSVFVRHQTIDAKLRSHWRYYPTVSNPSVSTDSDIYRAGFLTMSDVQGHLGALEDLGLEIQSGGHFEDACVVDQRAGPLQPCSWLLMDHLQVGGGPPVPYCRMVDDHDGPPATLEDMTVPNLWTLEGHWSIRPTSAGIYEPALSRTYNTPKEAFGRRMKIAGTPNKRIREVTREAEERWRALGVQLAGDDPAPGSVFPPPGERPRR